MVLTALLHIEGHETEDKGIPLLTCDYSLSQEVDKRGLAKSQVTGGIINFTFYSIEDEEIMWWMVSPNADKNGKISFSGSEDEKVFKTLEFKDARCVYYQETFSRDNEMMEEISISAREILLSGATHTNTWTKYDT
jgi:hypothetical protein